MDTMKAHDMFIQSVTTQFWGPRRRVVVAILVSLVLSTVAYGQGQWVIDDFEDGDAVDGRPFTWLADSLSAGGTREVVGGDYVLTHSAGAASNVLESVGATGDVSVRSQMRFSNSEVGNAAIYARAVAGISYFAGITRSGRVHVGKDGGAYHFVQTNLRPVDQDVTVQLDIVGDNISVKAWPSGDPEPEAPLQSFTDSTKTVGTVGVYMYGNTPEASVAFRDFGARGLPNMSVPSVPHDLILSWPSDEMADTYDVYLGVVRQDVSVADRANPLGVLVSQNQDANAFDPNGLLEFGQEYYWRIDAVVAAPDSSIMKGDVEFFAVEPFSLPIETITATASSSQADNNGPENTVNGSGLDAFDQHGTMATDMWLSRTGEAPVWIQYEFDKIYKLHEMWVWNSNQSIEPFVGLGAHDVSIAISPNGTDWTPLENVPQFAQGTGMAEYLPNTIVDFGNVSAKYVNITIDSGWGSLPPYGLSELRFFYIPTFAGYPHPAHKQTVANAVTAITWRPGRDADLHEVYFSTDRQAVVDGTALVDVVSENRYDYEPGTLDSGTTYYWKINELNESEGQFWEGEVWEFTTGTSRQ